MTGCVVRERVCHHTSKSTWVDCYHQRSPHGSPRCHHLNANVDGAGWLQYKGYVSEM